MEMFEFEPIKREIKLSKTIIANEVRNMYRNAFDIKLDILKEDNNRVLGITFKQSVAIKSGATWETIKFETRNIGGIQDTTEFVANLDVLVITNTRYIKHSELYEGSFVYLTWETS